MVPVMVLAIGFANAANAAQIAPPAVPADIALPADYMPIFVSRAVGTQNYICAHGAAKGGFDWQFIGPQATGFDAVVNQVLTHFASKNPDQSEAIHATWQHSRDSSAVWATRLAGSLDPAYVAPGAIEWLLLRVTGAQDGPTGGTTLSTAVYIHRVNTSGGAKPPASECTRKTLHVRRLVDYEADYYFYAD